MEVLFNPRCGKCRALASLLDGRGIAWRRIDYLDGALTREKLREVLEKLGCGAAGIIRWDERALGEMGISRASGLGEEALIDLILAHPGILQRPIAIRGERAVIARPPEKVLDLV
jgi:arsenate reductase